MWRLSKIAIAVPVSSLFMLFLSGCSAGNVLVSGSVVASGQPYQTANGQVTIVFVSDNPSTEFGAAVREDGTFVVYGPNADGLGRGVYRVGFYSQEGAKKPIRTLDAEKSELELDLTSTSSHVNLVIDLENRTISQK